MAGAQAAAPARPRGPMRHLPRPVARCLSLVPLRAAGSPPEGPDASPRQRAAIESYATARSLRSPQSRRLPFLHSSQMDSDDLSRAAGALPYVLGRGGSVIPPDVLPTDPILSRPGVPASAFELAGQMVEVDGVGHRTIVSDRPMPIVAFPALGGHPAVTPRGLTFRTRKDAASAVSPLPARRSPVYWPSQPGTSPAIPSILSGPANVRRAREPRNVRQYSLEHGWIGCRDKRR